jgi:hypothetical protein
MLQQGDRGRLAPAPAISTKHINIKHSKVVSNRQIERKAGSALAQNVGILHRSVACTAMKQPERWQV